MKKFLMALVSAVFLLAAPTVLAEDEPEEFNFEGDELSTDFLNPQLDVLGGLNRGRSSSLIKVRLDFVAEIVKSAEDI